MSKIVSLRRFKRGRKSDSFLSFSNMLIDVLVSCPNKSNILFREKREIIILIRTKYVYFTIGKGFLLILIRGKAAVFLFTIRYYPNHCLSVFRLNVPLLDQAA